MLWQWCKVNFGVTQVKLIFDICCFGCCHMTTTCLFSKKVHWFSKKIKPWVAEDARLSKEM